MPTRSNDRSARGRCQRWVTTTTLSMPALRSSAAVNTRVFPGRARWSSFQATGTPNSDFERGLHQRRLRCACSRRRPAADRDRQMQLVIGVGGKHQALIGAARSAIGDRAAVPGAHLAAEHDDRLRAAEIDVQRHAGLGPAQQPGRRRAGVAAANRRGSTPARVRDRQCASATPSARRRRHSVIRTVGGREKAERDDAFHPDEPWRLLSSVAIWVPGRDMAPRQPPRTYLRQTRRRWSRKCGRSLRVHSVSAAFFQAGVACTSGETR